jgi:ParB family chromosome partitioning protein
LASREETYGAVGRKDVLIIPPERFTVVSDPEHPLYDKRIHDPLDEAMVLNMMAFGMKKPIIFRINGKDKKGENILEIEDGRRRILHLLEANRRLRKAGEEPHNALAIPEKGTDEDAIMTMITTNSFTKVETIIDRVEKAKRLLSRNIPPEQVATTLGVSISTINNYIKLSRCSKYVQKAVEEGKVSAEVAKKIFEMTPEEQKRVIDEMIASGVTKGRAATSAASNASKGGAAKPSVSGGARMKSRNWLDKAAKHLEPLPNDDSDNDLDLTRGTVLYIMGDETALDRWPKVKKELAKIGRKKAAEQASKEPKAPKAKKVKKKKGSREVEKID